MREFARVGAICAIESVLGGAGIYALWGAAAWAIPSVDGPPDPAHLVALILGVFIANAGMKALEALKEIK